MNIGIDIRSTLKRRTGIGNYTFALVNALADVDRENTYFLYSYIRPFDIKRKLWPLPGRNFNHRVDRLSFRPERAVRSADVFHTSSYDIPGSRDCCLFTTVHDIVPFFFPQGYSDDYLSELVNHVSKSLVGKLMRRFELISDREVLKANAKELVYEEFRHLKDLLQAHSKGLEVTIFEFKTKGDSTHTTG